MEAKEEDLVVEVKGVLTVVLLHTGGITLDAIASFQLKILRVPPLPYIICKHRNKIYIEQRLTYHSKTYSGPGRWELNEG